MVSSSVYQNRSLLDRIYAVLNGYGYEVWMSHKDSLPVFSGKSNYENCLEAVETCDVFVGIVSPFYGSGRTDDGRTITHCELRKAIKLEKLRWILADQRVVFARQLLKQFRFRQDGKPRANFQFSKTSVLDSVGVIEMYEDATREDVPLEDRTGNWVHEYRDEEHAIHIISRQLSNIDRVREFLKRKEEGSRGYNKSKARHSCQGVHASRLQGRRMRRCQNC
ncbi:MAG: DUF4062 domain-containing protein [Planctomycetota bacterium]